jgi:hypothetical protein
VGCRDPAPPYGKPAQAQSASRLPNGRPPKLFREPRARIERLVESGFKDREIAELYGVTPAAVCRYRFFRAIPSPRAVRGWAVE